MNARRAECCAFSPCQVQRSLICKRVSTVFPQLPPDTLRRKIDTKQQDLLGNFNGPTQGLGPERMASNPGLRRRKAGKFRLCFLCFRGEALEPVLPVKPVLA